MRIPSHWFRFPLACALLALAACTAPTSRSDAPAAAPAAASKGAPDAPPKDVTAAMMAGEFAWQDGRAASAARHFNRAARLGKDPAVAEHATRVALAAREWDLASDSLARWKELDPKAKGIRQAEAGLALLGGKLEDAQAILLELLGGGPDGHKLVAHALIGSADPDAAVDALEKLSVRPDLPGGEDSLVLLSQVANQLKRDVLALAIVETAITRYPESAKAWSWRGHLKLKAEDQKGARADFAKAVALDPKNRELRLTYAAVLNEGGDSAEAARTLETLPPDEEIVAARAAYAARADDPALLKSAYEALEALPEPRPPARLELLGQLAELIKQRDEAVRWYKEVPRGEHYMDAQLRIAVLLDQGDKHAEAIALLETLRAAGIDDDIKLAESYLLEAELLLRREMRDAALAAYERGLKALPEDRRLLYARALLFEQLDRIPEAEADLRRVVALDPDDPDALNALGYTLADRTERHQEALELIGRALKLKPEEPAIIDSMGWVQYRLGNRTEALKHLRRAYELQPDAEIAAHLGEVLWVDGNRVEARKVWAEGKLKDAKNRTLDETMERLER